MTKTPATGKNWFKQHETLPSGEILPLSETLAHLSFDPQGLIPVIAQCHQSQNVLMMAWMNQAALRETLKTGQMCYWSRSRQALWRKGETSGHRQTLISLHIDCDGDAILAKVEQTGAACHTERESCFFWTVDARHNTVTLCAQVADS